MKKRIVIVLTAIICIMVFSPVLFLGTVSGETTDKNKVQVCLEQGRGYSAKAYILSISREADAVFELQLQSNYEIMSCSYADYTVTKADNGFTLLTLKNVRYPERITITCAIPSAYVMYDPNGGAFTGDGSTEARRIAYGPSVHLRINTLSGTEEVSRPGYVLIGWNTVPDGSGSHIGLGSRVTANKNETLMLYAEWEKETAQEFFSVQNTENGAVLTSFSGTDTSVLVIPREINGVTVTAIGAGFARDISIDRLVIPPTVQTIEDGAFTDCDIENIYFSDNLRQVSDAAFAESRPKYWHINAVMQPRYQAISDITSFADKMDLLILHQEEIKIILFSGCSMNYGMDSQTLAEAFPGYTVLNLGAVGGTNAQFQFECMLPFINNGDIFIHAPEQASPYQLMSSTACENRMFIAVEGNYDLLAMTDMTTLGSGAFDCFSAFNAKRGLMAPCTYDDQMISLNQYGDNAEQRIGRNDTCFDESYGLLSDLICDDGLDLLCAYYDRISAKGASVYLSYAPINSLCCDSESIAAFAEKWEQGMLERGYETISSLKDYIMDAVYFYDTDYHLTTSGAEIRAQLLTRDLISGLAPDPEN